MGVFQLSQRYSRLALDIQCSIAGYGSYADDVDAFDMGLGDDFGGFGGFAGEDIAGLVLAEEGFVVHGVQFGSKT